MKKYSPSEDVDFVIIGSGAGGAVMAKQLALAGFSVVVMEQGGWGCYGHDQDYNKDELSNRFPTEEDRLISDPRLHVNTFRRNASEKATPATSLATMRCTTTAMSACMKPKPCATR